MVKRTKDGESERGTGVIGRLFQDHVTEFLMWLSHFVLARPPYVTVLVAWDFLALSLPNLSLIAVVNLPYT